MQETSLQSKSIHELRSIASGYGVTDVFSLTSEKLIQEIGIKQQGLQPAPTYTPPPRPDYDSAIMTKRPAKEVDQQHMIKLLSDHIKNGLDLSFPNEDRWHMRFKEREDTGTCRMPPRVMMNCADRLMK